MRRRNAPVQPLAPRRTGSSRRFASTRRATLACVAAGSLALAVVASAQAAVVPAPVEWSADDARIALTPLGSYETGLFDAAAQEIVAYHARTKRLFTVNAELGKVEVLDASTGVPAKVGELDAAGTSSSDGSTVPVGAVANSVAVREDGLGVIAVESDVKTDPGWLVAFDARRLVVLGAVRVGALPDMVALSDDGRTAVVANEAEPSDDYSVDPEGSVAVVALSRRLATPSQRDVRIADFHAYEQGVPEGVRVFGPTVNAAFPVSANLEPEYVTIVGGTAYVTIQEANAIAVVDLRRAKVVDLWALGSKDYGVEGAGLDPSDRDGGVAIRTVPGLRGLYQPDGIASYTARGRTYLVTANEGDVREWGDYTEGARVKDLGDDGLAPICADSPLAGLTGDADLGRLTVTTASGLSADGSCYQTLVTFGTRSFSIWDTRGNLVYDSGDAIEQLTAVALPAFFNSSHTAPSLDNRSDDKGPEPEGVTIGTVQGRTYAFVGLERVGGVAAFDISRPDRVSAVTYVNNRDFSVAPEDGGVLSAAGDLGPEGLTFIPARQSPTGRPLVALANEVSGTTTVFEVETVRRGGHGHG